MSKKKLAKDALKSFLKTVKKIKSFDLKKTFMEDGNTFSKLSIIVKHKTDEVPELKKSKKKKSKSKKSTKKKGEKSVDMKVVKSSEPSKTPTKKKKTVKNKDASDSKAKPADTKPSTKKEKVTQTKAENSDKPATPKRSAEVAESKPVESNPIATQVAPKPVTTPTPKPAVKASTPATKTPVKRAASTRTRKPTVGDNLKLVEGIGPKIESFLKEEGIDTFEKLSKAIPEDIQKMLVAKGGTRYNANNPATWPEQAALAATGDMEAFNALKLELKGGRRV